MIKKLVLSGGSIKGYAYLGVHEYLEKHNLLENLDEIIGCSIGSLFGFFIVLGYSSKELKKIFLDEIFSMNRLVNSKIHCLFEDLGLDDGKRLEAFLKIFIRNKGYSEDITLKEISEKTKINLVATTCCVNNKTVEYMTNKDIPLYLAIRMSMNVPFIFCPVKYQDKLYVDGGLMSNFPIKYLKDKEYNPKEVLCFMLKGTSNCQEVKFIKDYFYSVVKLSLNKISENDYTFAKDKGLKIIILNTETETSVSFDVPLEERIRMYELGLKTMARFFEKENFK